MKKIRDIIREHAFDIVLDEKEIEVVSTDVIIDILNNIEFTLRDVEESIEKLVKELY